MRVNEVPSGQFVAIWYDPGGDIWCDTFKREGSVLYMFVDAGDGDEYWEQVDIDDYSQVWHEGNVRFVVKLDQVKEW